MLSHLRANLILLVLTVLLCSVAYPAILWWIGQASFRERAEGSLIVDREAVGSRLIAQPFTGEEYFKPRPSAVAYNAAASGASNYGAANQLLRDRVARQLGPIVKFANGEAVGPVVERWFQRQVRDDANKPVGERFVARWAKDHSAVAEQWLKDNIDAVADSLGKDVDTVKNAASDHVGPFFEQFAEKHPSMWPTTDDVAGVKKIKPVKDGSDVQAYCFDLWLQENPTAELQPVPADMVMASGSGLDPHITMRNALYQLDGVAAAWAKKIGRDTVLVRRDIERILNANREAPLGGLAGVPMVNVLEVNLALRRHFASELARRSHR